MAIGLFAYDQLAKRGFIGVVRAHRTEEGEYEIQTFFDTDAKLYDGPMTHLDLIKSDRQAEEYVKRRYTTMKHEEGETNGHG